MRRNQRRQIKWGVVSGLLAFAAGWAIAAYLTPLSLMPEKPRWQVTLWVYLGIHSVELSDIHTGGLGLGSNSINEIAPTFPVDLLQVAVAVLVIMASVYACYKISNTHRLKYCIHNALSVGTGYFFAVLGAMIISDMQPTITLILFLGLMVGGGIWIGSSLIGAVTRGLPFIGIASLGTVTMIGIFLIIGGIAIIGELLGPIIVSFGIPILVGMGVSTNRKVKIHGERQGADTFPRIRGIQSLLKKNVEIIVATIIILVGLFIGLQGGI